MKTLLAVLAALSLCANLALVAVLFAGRSDSAATSANAGTSSATPASAIAPAEPGPDTWATLSADDLPAMVQQLRTAGFPRELVRAIAAARIREGFAARYKALRPDAASQAFWKTATVDPRIRAAEFQLYREEQKALRDLLGADAEQPEMSIYQNRRFESVPAAKLDDVKDALRQFEERRQDIYSTAMGTITPEHQRRVAALEKEHQATLAGILSPTELEDFNLRNSNVASQVRYELAAFNPTEEEFRTVYRLQSQLEPYVPNMSQEEMQRRSEAQRQVREQIKAALGPVRAEEYTRATDYQYRQTSQLISRLELPPETTMKVWEVKQEIEGRANTLRRDTSIPPAERTKQLAALAEESTKKLTPLLGGARGMEAFKQYGGNWLQNLTPRARPNSPSPTAVRIGP